MPDPAPVPTVLGADCGHHCGAARIGDGSTLHVGHCPCPECHDTQGGGQVLTLRLPRSAEAGRA